jgi:hypothetical protein
MTAEQFWHGDVRLIGAYEKAYYRNLTFSAWVQGNYQMIAVEKGARNALASKKEHIDRTWVEYIDPVEKAMKTRSKIDPKKEQKNQEKWFFNTFFS